MSVAGAGIRFVRSFVSRLFMTLEEEEVVVAVGGDEEGRRRRKGMRGKRRCLGGASDFLPFWNMDLGVWVSFWAYLWFK